LAGILYLIPVPIGGNNFREVIPESVIKITSSIRFFIVENTRSARRYLKLIDKNFPVNDSVFYQLDEHVSADEAVIFLEPALHGHNTGLMSEAGMPNIADPGANIIKLAHKKGLKVVPLAGPSSVFLALAASGLNGQKFTFHGYLPVKDNELKVRIRQIEKESMAGVTQIFMETPYRAQRMFNYLIENCNPGTELCIAADISLSTEQINTRKIIEWKKETPVLKDRLVIFLLQHHK